jgi:hypothetical protein
VHNISFDYIIKSHKIVKTSCFTMLTNKARNIVGLNEVGSDFVLSSWILLGKLKSKATLVFCRAPMAKTIAAPYNMFKIFIFKIAIMASKE